jgi:hypothetical protein
VIVGVKKILHLGRGLVSKHPVGYLFLPLGFRFLLIIRIGDYKMKYSTDYAGKVMEVCNIIFIIALIVAGWLILH